VLRAMKRGYTSELYRRRIEMLRSVVPDIELGSDWIVGFPGEDDDDHAASEALLEEIGFAVNYVFKYDPRPGTHAASALVDDVLETAKKQRNQRLLAKSEEVGLKRLSAHVGSTRRVFVEQVSDRRASDVVGRTEHGLIASFAGARELIGQSVDVRIAGATAFGLSGTLA
jgi:tRNA-2-methylthio-N6-dimethylallyladenosine synthase